MRFNLLSVYRKFSINLLIMEINLSTRDMRAFLAVARNLSFSQAAQQMHLSQSALSSLIGRLEESFGTRLFDRTTRAVALSAAGAVLAAHAEQVLADLEHTVSAVRDVATLRKGSVAVAALPSLAARIVPELFRSFSAQYPDIRLSLFDTLSAPAFELVREGRVDFALTAANPAHSDLDYVALTSDHFVLLAAEHHALGKVKTSVRFTDTLAWPHISMSHPTSVRQYVDALALESGISFQPTYEVNHLATIRAMVLAQLGVAALPSMAADVILGDGIVSRPLVDPVMARSIGLVKRREGSLSPAAQTMIALLEQQVRAIDHKCEAV